MNVHDVAKFEYPTTCWLEAIFRKQHELAEKYGPIERQNGFHERVATPLNVQDRFAQYLIKDYAWRFTEEITESLECLQQYRYDTGWTSKPEVTHFQEELIDALHFLTEMSLMLKLTPSEIVNGDVQGAAWRLDVLLNGETAMTVGAIENAAFRAIMHVGMAMNMLKCKPWKVTHMPTDEARFRHQLVDAWHAFGSLLRVAAMRAEDVYDLYVRKNEVNAFRQRSKY